MRIFIVLSILAILPISCQFFLRRKFASGEDAQQAARKIIDAIFLAIKTHDVKLYLSNYDKSFIADTCGKKLTHADLEKDFEETPAVDLLKKYNVVNAVIEGDHLRFEVEAVPKEAITDIFTAVRNGAEFKLIKAEQTGRPCPSKNLYLQADFGNDLYDIMI